MKIAEISRYQGRWVAVDRGTDTVAADAADLAQLYLVIDAQQLADVVIQRVPAPDEPLFIGSA